MSVGSLQLTGRVVVVESADELYDRLAADLLGRALMAVKDREVFHLALSGGSTPEPFYIRLVTDPRFRLLPWQATHIWLVDERRVPADDERSNLKLIRETLAEHVPMRARHFHTLDAMDDAAADDYEHDLRHTIVPNPDPASPSLSAAPRLDFVLLGMGDDAHTASLFPKSEAINEASRLVVVNDGPFVTPPARITMTFPLLNAARDLAVLVTGYKKAATLRRVDEQLRVHGPAPHTMPITGIVPTDGALTWYLDGPSAGQEAKE